MNPSACRVLLTLTTFVLFLGVTNVHADGPLLVPFAVQCAPTSTDCLPFLINGDFATGPPMNGSYPIRSMDGTISCVGCFPPGPTTVPMTLLAPNTFLGNDNLLFPDPSPSLDFNGVSFQAGGMDFNLFFNTTLGRYILIEHLATTDFGFGHILFGTNGIIPPITPTPEASTLVLLGSGLLGLAAAIRRKLAR